MNLYEYIGWADDPILLKKSGVQIATGFNRVVHGGRGAYVEFTPEQIDIDSMFIPKDKEWRLRHPKAYYIEYRTLEDFVMVYKQKLEVDYADYIPGLFYISPIHLRNFDVCGTYDTDQF